MQNKRNCIMITLYLLISIFVFSEGKPSLTNATIEVKTIQLLGIDMTLASFQLTFDEDLYIHQSNMCPGYDCINGNVFYVNQVPCVCGYSDTTNCGVGFLKVDPSTSCLCETSMCSGDWKDVDLKDTDNATFDSIHLMAGQTSHFRLFANESCEGYRVFVTTSFGTSTLRVSNLGTATSENSYWVKSNKNEKESIFLCPTDSHFIQGTYFIAVYANTETVFDFSVERILVPAPNTTFEPDSCSGDLPVWLDGATCLHDGIPSSGIFTPISIFPPTPPPVFLFNISFAERTCVPVFVALQEYFPTTITSFYAGFVDEVVGIDYPGQARWSSSERESFVVCAENNELWKAIYIGLEVAVLPGTPSMYYVYASTGYFENHWTHTPLSALPPFEVNFDLLGSAALHTISGTDYSLYTNSTVYYLECNDWRANCKQFSYVQASENPNPFFPIPPVILNIPGTLNIFESVAGNFSLTVPPPFPRTFSLVLLVSYTTTAINVVVPEEELENITIRLLGKFGSLSGETVYGNFSAVRVDRDCDFAEYQENLNVLNSAIKEFSTAITTTQINTVRYKLDSASFQNGFSRCQAFVDSLTVFTSPKNVTIETFACTEEPGSVAWWWDPCCTSSAMWISTCNPTNITIPSTEFVVQETAVQNTCKHVECSQSYLEDYSSAKAAFESGQCSFSSREVSLRIGQVQKQYRRCKDFAYALKETCYSDSDCVHPYNNVTYPCSPLSRQCQVPYRLQETIFVDCLRTYLTDGQEAFLQSKWNITSQKENYNFTLQWLNSVTTSDCVSAVGNSVNLNHRTQMVTAPVDLQCAEVWGCNTYRCEDSTCLYPDTTCENTCGISEALQLPSQVACESDVTCNWNSSLCAGQSISTCASLCADTTPYFCGYCDSEDSCISFPELTSESVCASTSICLLLNGSYAFNLTESQCQQLGECNLDHCGHECVATNPQFLDGICFSMEANSAACLSKGGVWTNNTGGAVAEICVYEGTTESDCLTMGATWETCSDLSLYECSLCLYGACDSITQKVMSCLVQEKSCSDEPTCTQSGICSDSEYFVDVPTRYGGCIATIRLPPDSQYTYPYCPSYSASLPKGCLIDVFYSEETCYASGETTFVAWVPPATDEASCLATKGCLDRFNEQQKFSWKSEADCTSEYNQGEWTSLWDWTPGLWVGGTTKNLTWKPRQVVNKYNWTSTVSFLELESDFYGSASYDIALQSKSAALCRYERMLEPLTAVACDCSGDSSGCFETDPVSSIGQIQVCEDTNGAKSFPEVRLSFTNDSMPFGCVDVLVSQISRRSFETTTQERLLENFIPLTKKPVSRYAVYNDKDVAIGRLLSNGATLTILAEGSLEEFELCLQLVETERDFPKLDLATTDADQSKIIPLELSTYTRNVQELSVYDGLYLCSKIANLTGEKSFFAIERKDNYQEEEEELLDPTASALTYTLAVLFLASTILTSLELVDHMRKVFLKIMPFMLEHLLILFIWLFTLVRTIYFFLLAGGFDSAVGDYVLVALPTFFYFTAFSIIVVLWAVVASKRFTNDRKSFKSSINRILISVNGLLYAIFVALVLAFQFGKSTTESPCSGRQESTDNSNSIKQAISVTYGMLMAVTSLLFGILFVVFGYKIRKYVLASQSNEKIFVVTAVCSVCFLLHSIFIVVVSFMGSPNLYFSFFGLLITEWFPALFIMSWVFVRRASAGSSSTNNSLANSKPKSVSSSTIEMRHLDVS